MKDRNPGLLKRVWIISVVLILSMAVLPMPNGVVSGTITVNMELEAGWNLKGMPKSMTASDLALKSNHITSIVHRTSDGHYVSYIPSIGITDFILEVNEGVFIYSEEDTTITFTISTTNGYAGGDLIVTGDFNVTGDCVFDKNLTVIGSMSVTGNFEANSLNVTEDLTVDGDLTVNENLIIGADLTVNGNLMVAFDLIVGNMTITEDMTINDDLVVSGDARIDGDSTVAGDMVVLGNLTAGDFTVDYLTVSDDLAIHGNLYVDGDLSVTGNTFCDSNLTVNGTLIADYDVQVAGNLSVEQNTVIGGYLTVTGDATFDQDLTVNGNFTANKFVTNYVSESYTIGNLTVTGNATGLPFTETAGYTIFLDSGVVYAKNGNTGAIEFQSTNATYVIHSAIDALGASGGKIFIRAGTYELSNTLRIEHWKDPNNGTILLEGEGFNKNTVLKLTSASDLLTFVSLNGSSHLQFRNLQFTANKKADYGIRMERDNSGTQAGNHVFENVIVSNAKKVGILIYGSENVHLENVYATYGNPIGILVTSKPPVDDPTVINSTSVDTSALSKSTGGTTLVNCKLGHLGTTTKAALIAYGSHLRIFGGYAETKPDAEAVFILDDMLNQNIFSGVWIDAGPSIGFRIGNYSSYRSILTITSLTARAMSGTSIIEAEYLSGSVIEGVTTSKSGGKIVLGSTTRRNFVTGFINTPAGEYLTVEDFGIGNSIYQATVTIGNDLTVNGNLNVIGDLSVSGSMAVTGDLTVSGNMTVTGDIIGATGRSVSYVVAASDAPQIWKNQADWVCDGTNDHVEIQYALDNCTSYRGNVLLSPGEFNIANTISIPAGVSLEGMRMGRTMWGTKLDWVGGANDVIIYNAAEVLYDNHRGGYIRNLYIDGNDLSDTGIRLRMSMFHIVEFVSIRDCDEGIVVEASYSQDIRNCDITRNNNYGIYLSDYTYGGSTTVHCTRINIYGCEIGDNVNYNLYILSGTKVVLTETWFENNPPYDPQHLFIDDTGDAGTNLRATDNNFGGTGDQVITMTIQGGEVYLNHNFIVGGAGWGRSGIIMTGGSLHMEGNEVKSGGGGMGRALNITDCNYALIKGNTFIGYTWSNYNINVSGGTNIEIDGNHFTRGGIFSTVNQINIQNNIIDDITTPYGIYTTGSYNLIENNLMFDLQEGGIFVDGAINQILGNGIYRSGQDTNNTYDAIYIDGGRNKVDNNHIYSNVINKPRYGIFVDDEYYVSITNNFVEGPSTWDIYFIGGGGNLVEGNICPNGRLSLPSSPGDVYKDNIGFVTENSGTTSAGTSIDVTHGLAGTPDQVIVTPLGQTGYYYITNIGATNFTIISELDVAFNWYAIYKP